MREDVKCGICKGPKGRERKTHAANTKEGQSQLYLRIGQAEVHLCDVCVLSVDGKVYLCLQSKNVNVIWQRRREAVKMKMNERGIFGLKMFNKILVLTNRPDVVTEFVSP